MKPSTIQCSLQGIKPIADILLSPKTCFLLTRLDTPLGAQEIHENPCCNRQHFKSLFVDIPSLLDCVRLYFASIVI